MLYSRATAITRLAKSFASCSDDELAGPKVAVDGAAEEGHPTSELRLAIAGASGRGDRRHEAYG